MRAITSNWGKVGTRNRASVTRTPSRACYALLALIPRPFTLLNFVHTEKG
jgi:hypothetical protein